MATAAPAVTDEFRAYFAKVMELHTSLSPEIQQKSMDPNVTCKRKEHFDQADAPTADGVLNEAEYLAYTKLEHEHWVEVTGAAVAFDEALHKMGFACNQFEGKPGVTWQDIQSGNMAAASVMQEQMASQTS